MPARKRVLRRSAQGQGAELVSAGARLQRCGRMPRVLQLAANRNQNQAMIRKLVMNYTIGFVKLVGLKVIIIVYLVQAILG